MPNYELKTADEFGMAIMPERSPLPEDIALLDTVSAKLAEGCVTATSRGGGYEVHDEQYLTLDDVHNRNIHYSVEHYTVRGTDGNGTVLSWLNQETGEKGSISYISPNAPLWYKRHDTLDNETPDHQRHWMKSGGALSMGFNETSFPQERVADLTQALASATPNPKATRASAKYIEKQGRVNVTVPAEFGTEQPDSVEPNAQEHTGRQRSKWAKLGSLALRIIKR